MDNKKFCKLCKNRSKSGYCQIYEKFVPKKQTKEFVNPASNCQSYKS